MAKDGEVRAQFEDRFRKVEAAFKEKMLKKEKEHRRQLDEADAMMAEYE